MNCDEWLQKLYKILDRDMSEISWKEVEAHMKDCRPCWDRFEFEKRLKDRVKNSCRTVSCTESFRLRIKAIFQKY
jgi:mycothiol system anti-sigma-R factor